jgi:hypothetical protein
MLTRTTGEPYPHGAAEAIVLALDAAADVLGDGHPDTLISRHHLASAYRAAGRRADAKKSPKRAQPES